jgi:hypothetical protein
VADTEQRFPSDLVGVAELFLERLEESHHGFGCHCGACTRQWEADEPLHDHVKKLIGKSDEPVIHDCGKQGCDRAGICAIATTVAPGWTVYLCEQHFKEARAND